MEPQTVNSLSKFFEVDRSTIQRLIDRADIVPEMKGRTKQYPVGKVAQLLFVEVKDKAYKHGFTDGKQQAQDELDNDEESGQTSLAHEKWRQTRAQADKLELDNAERREKLAPLEAVIQRDRIVASSQAQLFDSLVVRIRRQIPDIPDKVLEVVTDIVAKCRNEMSSLVEDRIQELEQAMERQDKEESSLAPSDSD